MGLNWQDRNKNTENDDEYVPVLYLKVKLTVLIYSFFEIALFKVGLIRKIKELLLFQ